jgi:hypothetical protein
MFQVQVYSYLEGAMPDLEPLMLSMKDCGALFVMIILIKRMQKLCALWLDTILCKSLIDIVRDVHVV